MLAIIVWGMGMVLWVLFWWGNNNENPVVQDNPEQFTDQFNTTWENNNLDINEKHDISSEPNTNKEYTEIRVMMPKYFYTSWWKSFAQDLYNTQKVYMNFIFIDNLNQYRDSLSSKDFNEADLILFPYDWIESIAIRPFSFQQSIKSEFDEFISPIVNDSQTAFLPFSADPMIMYVLSGYDFQNNFSEILEFVHNREAKKPRAFPIFFGLLDEDYYNEWITREYQDIVRYALMHYFTTHRNSNSLQQWMDSNVFENYNLSNMKNIINALSNTPNCEYFTSICTQIYNFVAIRFGFLSDSAIVKQYFPKKKTDFENISKNNMPFSSIESPVRVRWRAIPKSLNDTDTINAVYKFLWQYMTNHNQYDLWNSTLSVFTYKWDELMDNPYISQRWYIMKTWGNYIKLLRNMKSFWQLLNYEISAKDYIKRI